MKKINKEYPMMANWLKCCRLESGAYYVKNILTDEEFEVEEDMFDFLSQLDGDTDSNTIPTERNVEVLMDVFEEAVLLRTGERTIKDIAGNRIVTLLVPETNRRKSFFPILYNCLLLFLWCPILLFGIWVFQSRQEYYLNHECFWLEYLLAIVVGALLHEVSHAMACLAYDGYFFEAGIGKYSILPIAYVMIDYEDIPSRLKRIQVMAAGTEMNFLLGGLCLFAVPYGGRWDGAFYLGALVNLWFGVFNLSFIKNMDGCTIISELLDLPNGLDDAKNVWKGYWKNPFPLHTDMNKTAELLVALILIFYQLLLPLLVTNVLSGVLGGFL